MVLNHDDQKGVVTPRADQLPVLVPKKSPKRGSLTHVVLVCDDTAVQPLLPQMIIGNEHILRVQDLHILERESATNIYVVRAKSSWITAGLFIFLLQTLTKKLRQNAVTKQPILLLDGSPVHVTPAVWQAARRNGIFLCFIPASLTWFVQPLDVSIIRKLKAHVRSHYRKMQIEKRQAEIPVVDVIRILMESVRTVLQGVAWAPAFDACGYSAHENGVCSQIRRMFARAPDLPLSTPTTRPPDREIENILPKKRVYDFHALLWTCPVEGQDMRHGASVAASSSQEEASTHFGDRAVSIGMIRSSDHMLEHDEDSRPIALRTRSRSALLQDAPDESASFSTARGSAEPCPLWTSSERVDARRQTDRSRTPRPQALPAPKKPAWT